MSVLREGLLAGRSVAVGGGAAYELRDRLVRLGARAERLEDGDALRGEEEGSGEWARSHAPLDALVYDATPAFSGGGSAGLKAALDSAWMAIREVAGGELIPSHRGGKIVLLAPRPRAGPFAQPTCAALENLVRTLSVEWARYAVTTTLIAPGDEATDDEIAELTCFLVSGAADYFSGCRFDLALIRRS
jgi:hypothetical protein